MLVDESADGRSGEQAGHALDPDRAGAPRHRMAEAHYLRDPRERWMRAEPGQRRLQSGRLRVIGDAEAARRPDCRDEAISREHRDPRWAGAVGAARVCTKRQTAMQPD